MPLFDKGKELEAFVAAIKAGKILQDQHAYNLEVMNALQEALNQRSQRNNLEGHDGPVYSVSFSADGKTLASGSDDRTIKLWNRSTGKEIRTLQGHDNLVYSVSFSAEPQSCNNGDNSKKQKNLPKLV